MSVKRMHNLGHKEWLVEFLLLPALALAVSLGPIIWSIAEGDWLGLLEFATLLGYTCVAWWVAVATARLISIRTRRGMLSLLAWPIWIGILLATGNLAARFIVYVFDRGYDEYKRQEDIEMTAEAIIVAGVFFAAIGICCHLVYKLHLHLERRN